MGSEAHCAYTRIALMAFAGICACSTAGSPSPQDLAGIAHVAFRVTDVERSRTFYRSLGFEQAFEFADPGKPLVSYIKVNDRQFIELYGRRDESQPIGLMHMCYETPNIEAVRKEYVTRGIAAPESRKARAGNLLFSINDPGGQMIEFTQYLPGSLHYNDRGKHIGKHRISDRLLRVVVPLNDVAVAASFYVEKLGFQEGRESGGCAVGQVLRLPGESGEELGIANATVAAPRVAFAVSDVARTAKELGSRRFRANVTATCASIADPDGTVIEFMRADREER
jgi:catechol 2,3-dioxygenase-like lactoylglutathione lyase family enzyme